MRSARSAAWRSFAELFSGPASLSPAHFRVFYEVNAGPFLRVIQTLQSDPDRLAAFRREFEEIVSQFFEDNTVRQDYLMTRATKI